jgi:hypothetical protein
VLIIIATGVRVAFFPLDERLKLGAHSWTPETVQLALRQATEIASYRRAANNFTASTKLPMSKSSLERLVLEYGGEIVARQAVEAEATVTPPERDDEVFSARQLAQPDSEVMAVSLDGCMVHMREEGWKEVKTVAISAVETVVSQERDEEKEVRLTRHSYRAGLWDAKTFAKQQWAEGCRRSLERARQIVAVADGALWIWLIIAMCYAPCIEIIDWWHAVEKLWAIGNTLLGQGDAGTTSWVEGQKSLLWAGHLRAVLAEIRRLCPRGQPLNETSWAVIHYIYSNRRRMDYQRFRQAGYPVGSGTVESACKVVVEGRMKQAGMRWSRAGAQAMLALRSVLLSEQWDTVWSSLQPAPKPA